jgi:hypothetical protein
MTEQELTQTLIQLADLGVTGIRINYEGGGDSGCIEDIMYTDKEGVLLDEVQNLPWGSKDLKELNNELAINIENFTTDTILDDIEDWWNNEGGSGTLAILVPSGEYNVENNIRRVDYDEFFHEGNLFRKTED